jgi:hypothetical protein
MALLFDQDYDQLTQRGFSFEESAQQRFFIFKDYPLPPGLYTVSACDVLVLIPLNYNQAGNDMFWTFPRLQRIDGKNIPNTSDVGSRETHLYNDREYCRWSRHWNSAKSSEWRPGKDDIISIQRRIDWALRNPDT